MGSSTPSEIYHYWNTGVSISLFKGKTAYVLRAVWCVLLLLFRNEDAPVWNASPVHAEPSEITGVYIENPCNKRCLNIKWRELKHEKVAYSAEVYLNDRRVDAKYGFRAACYNFHHNRFNGSKYTLRVWAVSSAEVEGPVHEELIDGYGYGEWKLKPCEPRQPSVAPSYESLYGSGVRGLQTDA